MYTEKERLDMVELYITGMTAPEVADVIGCCRETVYNALEEHGIKRRGQGHGKKKYEHIKDELIAKWNSGIPGKELGKYYGLKKNNIYAILHMWREEGQQIHKRDNHGRIRK